MTFSAEWDSIYEQSRQLSIWPWTDLVSLVMRHAPPRGPGYRVLELGCGAGANVPFFLHLGADYHAVEGSEHIVQRLRARYPQLADRFAVGDFTRAIPFQGAWDLVVDRSSLTHNRTAAIARCLKLVRETLKPGGAFVGIDWFSTAHSEMVHGKVADDPFTRHEFTHGQFAGVGRVHFSDEAHLRSLFAEFDLKLLEHKTVDRREPPDPWHFASWNLLAVRR